MMRALAAAACLVAIAIVLSGCGVDQTPGQIAVRTIEDDWVGFFIGSNDPFPAQPELAGKNTLRRIRCQQKMTVARTLTCTLVAGHGASGGTAVVARVLVTFDAQGVLRKWKFIG